MEFTTRFGLHSQTTDSEKTGPRRDEGRYRPHTVHGPDRAVGRPGHCGRTRRWTRARKSGLNLGGRSAGRPPARRRAWRWPRCDSPNRGRVNSRLMAKRPSDRRSPGRNPGPQGAFEIHPRNLTPGDIGLAQSPKPIEGLSATVARRNPEAHRSAGRGIPSLEGAESGREAEEKNGSGGRPLRCDGRRCLPELRTPAAPTRGRPGAATRRHSSGEHGPNGEETPAPPSALQGPAAEATGPFGTETEAGPSPPVTEGLHR
ncbi:hypothetical protein WMY93_029750 [Mugilogobius chulae]|uniref:Uncharacterized protein n=1 Tax=Mugilogobius chulae TaxID=88201 RepID=A0AAW0MQ78_9GOBI